MAAAGLPEPRPDHAEVIAEFALAINHRLQRLNPTTDVPFEIRIGIHTGPVVAGVIGSRRFLYDGWGDTVNLASRLESHGAPGRIHVSESTRDRLAGRYAFEGRGLINLKGIGKVRTAFLTGRHEDAAAAAAVPRRRPGRARTA